MLKGLANRFVYALPIAFVIAGLAFWGWSYKDRAEKAELGLKIVESKFNGCQEVLKQLHQQTQEREEKAAKALKEAQSVAADYRLRADKLLRQPAAVPGDDCASARVRARNWLEERK